MAARRPTQAHLPEEEWVPLSEITVSNTFQIRDRLDRSAVNRYAAAMRSSKEFPPVTLARISGSEGLFLIDGFHRVQAANLAGLHGVSAVIEDLTPEEALWRAASANLKHGLPLTSRRERRALFDAYIRARRYRKKGGGVKSLREISDDLEGAINFSTVRKWLMRDYPSIYERHFKQEGGAEEDDSPLDPAKLAAEALARALDDALATIENVHSRLPNANERNALKRRLAAFARDLGRPRKYPQDEDF